jgi:hypothetical protein
MDHRESVARPMRSKLLEVDLLTGSIRLWHAINGQEIERQTVPRQQLPAGAFRIYNDSGIELPHRIRGS